VGKSYRGARVRRKKGEEEITGKGVADEEGGKEQEKEVGHQGGEEGGEGRVGPAADKDIPPITSAKGVITINNDL